MKQTGRYLQDTGSTVNAFAGEEVDWYCCNVGRYHVRQAMNPSVGVAEDEDVKRWVLDEDSVVVRAVASAVGMEGLSTLVAHFLQEELWLHAARVEWAAAETAPGGGALGETGKERMRAALALIEKKELSTHQAQQLVSE